MPDLPGLLLFFRQPPDLALPVYRKPGLRPPRLPVALDPLKTQVRSARPLLTHCHTNLEKCGPEDAELRKNTSVSTFSALTCISLFSRASIQSS